MKVLALLFALLLTACGGGGSDDLDETTRAALAAPVKVMLYGDSTQAGSVYTNGVNPSTVAQQRFDRAGANVIVQQDAVGTSTAQELLTGTDPRHTLPFEQMLPLVDAQIVGFRFGLTDRRHYDADEFGQHLEALLTLAEAAGKVVILETPSPTDLNPTADRRITRNVGAIRRLASSHPSAVLCDHHRVGMAEGYENRDGFHPTARAYRLWQGPTLARCIKEAMAKLPQ